MNYEFNLDVTPGGMPPILHMSQYDTDRTYTAKLYNGGTAVALDPDATAVVKGYNGKNAFEIDCTIIHISMGHTTTEIEFQLTAASTDQFGKIPVTIEIDNDGATLSPLCMIFDVQRAGYTNEQAANSPEFQDAMEEAAQKYVLGMDLTARTALLDLLSHVAYIDQNGQDYYDALELALRAKLSYIVADYAQDHTVYDTDSLDVLKEGDDLIVTAYYDDGTHIDLADSQYTLSGTLTAGTSTITVSYGGKTTTITVVVTHQIVGWYYPFNGSLLSSGTEDFGLVGDGVYGDGFDTRQAYKHISPDGTTDEQMGLKAINVTKMPNLGGDFTLSFWCKTKSGSNNGKPIFMTHWETGTQPSTPKYFTSPTTVASGWTVAQPDYSGRALSGVGVQLYNGKVIFRIHSQDLSASAQLTATPPSGFTWDSWHHYAFTRKGNTVRIFVDGVLIGYATASYNTARNAGQVALSAYFYQNEAQATDIMPNTTGEYLQDLFIAEYCKWESAFDPTAIEY